jgi:hypothetical protein
MRRVLIAALIGGMIGFAVLLQIASDKAGCWGFQNLNFSNVILLPIVESKISNLMYSARLLIFQMEILNSGFEFFVRGAGSGIILLLLYDETIKSLKKLPLDSLMGWLERNEPTICDKLCLLAIAAGFTLLLPLLLFTVQMGQYLFCGMFDALTVAIFWPSLVLLILILAAAYKKRLFLWQCVQPQDLNPRENHVIPISFQILVFTFGIAIGNYFMYLCHQYFVAGVGAITEAPRYSLGVSYFSSVETEIFNTLASSFCAGLIVYVLEVWAYFSLAGESIVAACRKGACGALLVCVFLQWILPAIYFYCVHQPNDGVLIRQFTIDVYRWVSSFSTIPTCLFGLAVAIAPNFKRDSVLHFVEPA